jgi:CheY-like chemotaxis protein/anti-sigma regulatory factor (Ser/Thr protein kinase)
MRDEQFKILIVDDEEGICRILMDLFKSQGYLSEKALNGAEALALIEKQVPDLVVSDIHMPVMDGFELFRNLDLKYPSVKHVLMTSYDVDQYISDVRRFNIGNILVKGPDFSLHDVSGYIRSLLTGQIFGLERYFPGRELHKESINSYARSKSLSSHIAEHCEDASKMYLEIAIDELISNAVFHGVLQLTGIPREQWQEQFVIEDDNLIRVTWAHDQEKIGVAIEDPKGNLKKMDVLQWLDRREGDITDGEEHGRGFLLIRKLIDRFIINIDPGKRTECIIIQYFDRLHVHGKKPLLIHEL